MPSDVPAAPLLVRAARGEAVERPPVWAMRQAGRWDPQFNRVRADLSFYEFSANVERSAKASLLPRRFGVDGIILFYDITTLPMAMGQCFALQPSRGRCRITPSARSPTWSAWKRCPTRDVFSTSAICCAWCVKSYAANCRCWSSPGRRSPWRRMASAPARTSPPRAALPPSSRAFGMLFSSASPPRRFTFCAR